MRGEAFSVWFQQKRRRVYGNGQSEDNDEGENDYDEARRIGDRRSYMGLLARVICGQSTHPMRGMKFLSLLVLSVFCLGSLRGAEAEYDVVIYGGTSAGVAAAVQAKRLGKTVVVIEPTKRLGGLSSGGLGQTDIGNKAAIGGIAREFYQDIRKHYNDPAAWKFQTRHEYKDDGQTRTLTGEETMWTFEPSAALKVFNDWVKANQIEVVYGERLDRKAGAAMTKSIPWRIMAIKMESGKMFRGKMFIDATYEGDLMAVANVSYTVGREANAQYGETLNGVQTKQAKSHQLFKGIDPYIKKGDPSSGLLPHIDPKGPGEEGGKDHRVQAYCFRMCLTDAPENRIPFHKPEGYNELWYELLFRNFEAGERGVPWINSGMPNRKTDTNNKLGFSTDFIGQNYDYPEASYEEREKIVAKHRLYQQGLMWTLANHPRIPENIRKEVSRWGMSKDEFVEGNGWQEQIYVREARRMVSDYVMSQNDCQGKTEPKDPVGLAAYTMDSHNQQRYVDTNGQVRNEGDVQVGGFSPYPISYKSIVPQVKQCANLLVPVCLSASHIAYGSIRMEPVFMVLGQSAATAAAQAIDEKKPVQGIDYQKLHDRLAADKQVLIWTGPKKSSEGGAAGLDPKKLEGIVIDDEQATLHGFGMNGHVTSPYVAAGYRHDGNEEKGQQSAVFPVKVAQDGKYEVRIGYSVNGNRATNVPVKITHAGGVADIKLNQKKTPAIDKLFQPVGQFEFKAGKEYSVEISNKDTDGYVLIDAVQLVIVK
jgi:hypothetical protein